MSQRSVERALGKLVTDAEFRRRFYADPAAACLTAGLELTAAEMDALARVPEQAVTNLERSMDGRLCRLVVDAEPHR